MKKQKIATVVTCCALVGAIAVGGTLALVSSQTKTITNKFTVGDGFDKDGSDFYIDEAKVKVDTSEGNFGGYIKDGEDRVAKNEYTLTAGTTIVKDPTMNWTAGTDKQFVPGWVVVKVSGLDTTKTSINDLTTGWKKVEADGTYKDVVKVVTNPESETALTDGTYIYTTMLTEEDPDVSLFNSLKVENAIYDGDGNAVTLSDLVVEAVAVQAVKGEDGQYLGFDDVKDAVVAAANAQLD